MPRVKGFLRIIKRRPGGRPDIGLPDEEDLVDPDYGIEEGGDGETPDPPPGIWPPLTPEHPWVPYPPLRPGERPPSPDRPGGGTPEHPIELPPGAIWPPLPPDVHGKFLALVLIAGTPGYAYRYVVIDADARPGHPHPEHPTAPGGTPQPKGR